MKEERMPDEVFIQSLFRKYSVNNEISVDTLEKVCNDNGIPLDWNEMQIVKSIVDLDKNGTISYEEFKIFWNKTVKFNTCAKLDMLRSALAEFGKFDENGDGSISREEFKEICKAYNWDLTEEQELQAMNALDTNHDGVISFEEFVDWLNWGIDWK